MSPIFSNMHMGHYSSDTSWAWLLSFEAEADRLCQHPPSNLAQHSSQVLPLPLEYTNFENGLSRQASHGTQQYHVCPLMDLVIHPPPL